MDQIQNNSNASDPIIIPSGTFEAPFDSRICYTQIEGLRIPTIEQTIPGNCAEYSALDASLMALSLGYSIGDELTIFLNKHSLTQVKDTLEAGFVLPVLQTLHELPKPCGFSVSQSDRQNAQDKQRDIYAALEGTNAALIFWTMLNGTDKNCPMNNLQTSYTPELNSRLRSTQDLAILVGNTSLGHATAIFKSNGGYFSIDSLRIGNVVKSEREESILSGIASLLNQRRGYILLSDLRNEE